MTKQLPVLERLWKRTVINKDTGCWLLSGFKDKDGYVRVYYLATNVRVNRLSAHLFLGLDLKDKKQQSNHKFECPNRNCWNPEHLYVGNQYQNVRDSMKAGTHSVQPFCRD
jgi:hypothetical protein